MRLIPDDLTIDPTDDNIHIEGVLYDVVWSRSGNAMVGPKPNGLDSKWFYNMRRGFSTDVCLFDEVSFIDTLHVRDDVSQILEDSALRYARIGCDFSDLGRTSIELNLAIFAGLVLMEINY